MLAVAVVLLGTFGESTVGDAFATLLLFAGAAWLAALGCELS